jgi:hypothetical protein
VNVLFLTNGPFEHPTRRARVYLHLGIFRLRNTRACRLQNRQGPLSPKEESNAN